MERAKKLESRSGRTREGIENEYSIPLYETTNVILTSILM